MKIILKIFCVTLFILLFWIFFPFFLLSEQKVKTIAEEILREEMINSGVKFNQFYFKGIERKSIYWRVNWGSKEVKNVLITIGLSPFDQDYWADPFYPDCKNDREKTIIFFGQVCI